MKGYILSIDQGTGGSKAIIFDHSGEIVSYSFHEVTSHCLQPGWVEQDANEIWLKTQREISDALIDARILPDDIRVIGISNQRCTTLLWNKKTGEPIGRAIVWQDRRSQQICDRLSVEVLKEKTLRGLPVFVGNAALAAPLRKDRGEGCFRGRSIPAQVPVRGNQFTKSFCSNRVIIDWKLPARDSYGRRDGE